MKRTLWILAQPFVALMIAIDYLLDMDPITPGHGYQDGSW